MNPNETITVWESVTIATDPRRINVFEDVFVYDIWENKKRYWVGGTGNWDATAGTKWATSSGGVGGAAVPTSSDDVYFDANSTGTVTVAATAYCLNFDCTGFTGLLTGTSAMNVYGNYTLGAGMTMSYGGLLSFVSTEIGRTITTNGKAPTSSTTTFNGGGGEWILQDSFISSGSYAGLNLVNGTLNTNGKTVTLGQYFGIDIGTKTLTLGASIITAPAFYFDEVSGFTLNYGTSKLVAIESFLAYGLTFYDVEITAANGYGTISQSTYTNYFRNLSILNTSAGSAATTISAGSTCVVSGTFTASSSTSGFRSMIRSSTVGISTSIVAATTAISNCDFSDIAASGAASWSGTSIGNAFGNSGITFTTPVTRYAVGISSSDNWSSTASWSTSSGGASGASVPICHDTVYLNSSSGSGTLYADTRFLCADLICTGFTGTININATRNTELYGSLTLGSGMVFTVGNDLLFMGRSSHTITSAGKAIGNISYKTYFYNFGGSITLQDDTTFTSQFRIENGTFNANNKNVTLKSFYSGTSNSTINMGSGTWTITGSTSVWTASTSAGALINCDTSTIDIADASTATKYFQGGNKTYYILKTSGAGIAEYQILGSNTFDTITSTKTVAYTLAFAAGSVQTISNFLVSGSAGNLVTLTSTSTSAFGLTKAGTGNVICNYLNIAHSIAQSTGKWYARNSVNNQSVATAGSGWIFTEPSFSVSDTITKTESVTTYNSGYNFTKYETVTPTEYLSFRVFTPDAVEPNETVYVYDIPWVWIRDPQGNNRYWVGGTGNWTDKAHWAFTSGGMGGAPIPTPLDDVFIDTNSGLSSGGTISLTYLNSQYWTCMCHDFTSTVGTSYNIDYVTSDLSIYGSSVFEKHIIFFSGTWIYFVSNDESNTITTNDVSFDYILFGIDDLGPWPLPLTNTTTYDIYGDLYVYDYIEWNRGVLNFNTSNVYYTSNIYLQAGPSSLVSYPGYGSYNNSGLGDVTVNMGSGTWTVHGDFHVEGSGGYYPIVNPQTSTLKLTYSTQLEVYSDVNAPSYIGSLNLNNVIVHNIESTFYFIGNITIKDLTLLPSGNAIVFPAEKTGEDVWDDGLLSVESIISYGAIDDPIYIYPQNGDFCKVSSTSDTVTFYYTETDRLRVLDASSWFMGESVDLGGNEGLFFYNQTDLIPDRTVKSLVAGFQNGGVSWSNYTTLTNGGIGQSFYVSFDTTLDSVHLFLTSFGLVTGTAEVRIYTHTGSYGTTGTATTPILAVSDPFDVEQLRLPRSGYGYYASKNIFNFSGVNRIKLVAGNVYVAVLVYNNGTATEYLGVAYPTAVSTFGGNACTFSLDMNTVTAQPTKDLFISVYGMSDLSEPPVEDLTITDAIIVEESDLTNYISVAENISVTENISKYITDLFITEYEIVNISEVVYGSIYIPTALTTQFQFEQYAKYVLSFDYEKTGGDVLVYQGSQLIFSTGIQMIRYPYQHIHITESINITII